MDLKQALQQRGGGNASNNNITNNTSNISKSSANSIQSDGGNNSSCSNNNSTSTNTGESNRGSSPVAASFLSCGGALLNNGSSNNTSGVPPVSHLTGRARPPGELDAHDPRLLKLARLHDPPSPHSSTLETQVLFNLNGSFNNRTNSNPNNINNAASHHPLSSYLSSSNHSSNHGSPTSNYAGSSTCSLFNGGSPHSKLYPYASLQEEPIRQHQSPFMLTAVPAPQASLLSSARAHHASLPCFNPEPVATLFTPEQLLEFTQQTYVFKHFVAGVTPPPTLLLPIINSVASMGRFGVGSIQFGSNAGLFGVGGLRGNIDPEPGRCRRTDGKKWRCAREVVADQKYCERHMHRGRHRARANKLANGGATEAANTSSNLPPSAAANTAHAHSTAASSGISTCVPTPFVSSAPKEPHLHFSLQTTSAAATQLSRSSSDANHTQAFLSSSDPAGGLKRLLESNNIGGPLSRSLSAQPENPPNLADLLKANSSKSSLTTQIAKAQHHDSPFPFACQNSDRDAETLALRHFVDGDHWSRIGRGADNPPPSLSWVEQLAEEQNKRSRFNTELSIATHKSPLINLSNKFGGDQQEALVGDVDASHFMGLSMDLGAKVGGIAKIEEDRYSGRSSWVPIAWESPSIGGPLGEVLQSNAANSGGHYGGSLANNGGERCLNLIEEESWVQQDGGHASSPAKDGHSPSLASPTGVLQIKASFASYSDSSSSASSPRSALKLESANLGI